MYVHIVNLVFATELLQLHFILPRNRCLFHWSISIWNIYMATRKQILPVHDDVIKWKYFPCYWPFVRGIPRSLGNSPHKGQWRGALMFSLICAWINGWVNNREAGDLRRHRAHYDVIVIRSFPTSVCLFVPRLRIFQHLMKMTQFSWEFSQKYLIYIYRSQWDPMIHRGTPW